MSSKRTSIQVVEAAQLKDNIPDFNQGDTVLVEIIVKEGDRERSQPFEGVVIGIKNRGLNKSNPIIIYESTVYPGVTEDICVPLIEKNSGKKYNSK